MLDEGKPSWLTYWLPSHLMGFDRLEFLEANVLDGTQGIPGGGTGNV